MPRMPETDVAEEVPTMDKVLSRVAQVLEYFGSSPGEVSPRYGTAEETREMQAPPPETPEPAPVEEASVAAPQQETGVLERMAGSQQTERSQQTLDAARSALENYRNSSGNPNYEEDIV